jgi:uncharacterized protein YceK
MLSMKNARALGRMMVAVLALASAGCGTINDMTKGDQGQRIYGGVRQDAGMISGGNSQTAAVLGIIDFPFSFVLDTAFLPITLIVALFRSGR